MTVFVVLMLLRYVLLLAGLFLLGFFLLVAVVYYLGAHQNEWFEE